MAVDILVRQPPFGNSADRVLSVWKVEQVCKDSPRNSRSSPFIHLRAQNARATVAPFGMRAKFRSLVGPNENFLSGSFRGMSRKGFYSGEIAVGQICPVWAGESTRQ